MLAGWPTPMAGTPAQNGNNEAGNTDSGRKTVEMCQWPLNEQAQLSGWATPKKADGEQGSEMMMRGNLTLLGEARLTAFGDRPIGYLLGPNGWEIVPACGQLNAAHSRWLMGLPGVWDDCGVTAMESSRKSRRRSSERTATK